MRVVLAGAGLTVVVTALLFGLIGRAALLPGLVMGAVATLIELAALRAMRRGLASRGTEQFFGAVVTGLMLRVAGVVVFVALVLWDRTLFPPLPTAIGFVGVLIPLLFLEVRLVR